MLSVAEPYIEKNVHPTIIVQAYFKALEDAVEYIDKQLTFPIDVSNLQELSKVVEACIGTKFTRRHSEFMTKIAIEAVKTVEINDHGKKEIDIKRFAKTEKVRSKTSPSSKRFELIVTNQLYFIK